MPGSFSEIQRGTENMGAKIRKAGKFCSSVIMGNISIFMFIGLLSVVFHENGWIPNKEIYQISQYVYKIFLPVCIAYTGGERTGGKTGGCLAVLAAAGALSGETALGIPICLLLGPAAGVLWKRVEVSLEKKSCSSLKMLTKNLAAGILGSGLAIFCRFCVPPVLKMVSAMISLVVTAMLGKNLLAFLNLVIEPAKVFFLNNILNYGVLTPIALSELEQAGESILFLLESNPGPGIGMLTALYFYEKKEIYLSALAAHGAGGIHEVYFPFVLTDMWLLIPLTISGMAGTLWFEVMGAGVRAPVSPGSVITILVMAGKENLLLVAGGILLSSLVSFLGSMAILKWQHRRKTQIKETSEITLSKERKPAVCPVEEQGITEKEKKMPVRKIGFICDAGVGSSVMGATIFRRILAGKQIEGVTAEAYAVDCIPDDLDLLVCQKDFYRFLPDKGKEIFVVDNFVSMNSYDGLMQLLTERNF